jgi:hypothetical protein
MTNSITPPPELVQQWINEEDALTAGHIATQAAQWGADQELEALLVWLRVKGFDNLASDLLSTRRPKPPSLKEQALEALQFVDEKLDLPLHNHCNAIHTIRAALEALDD